MAVIKTECIISFAGCITAVCIMITGQTKTVVKAAVGHVLDLGGEEGRHHERVHYGLCVKGLNITASRVQAV